VIARPSPIGTDEIVIEIYTQREIGRQWLRDNQDKLPKFACILGFTETGLINGISAAGATPEARQYTAIADAEFLANGPLVNPQYPLPPLQVGISPAFISRAVIEAFEIPVCLFNAGLPHPPAVPAIDLQGVPARCLSTGQALPRTIAESLLGQGLSWGEKLAAEGEQSYLTIAECVVGGTTTALSVLTALGIDAAGKVNSSHPRCNHAQKWEVARAGLQQAGLLSSNRPVDPLRVVASVGDPMQVVAAGMAIAASRTCGVMLAGGTQMIAVYALAKAIAESAQLPWQPEQVAVGTTRWVTEDRTGNTVGLADAVQPLSLFATQLSFATSRYSHLRAYERGYVKEGVGAGGAAIAAHLNYNWTSTQLLAAIEGLIAKQLAVEALAGEG